MGALTCASVEHDADRHVILAEPYGDAEARYAQRAVQLMRPAQQLIAVLLVRHKGTISAQQNADHLVPALLGCSSMVCTMEAVQLVRHAQQMAALLLKKNHYTSSRQLRADQAPDPPWGDRLIYTAQIDITDL